MKAEEVKNKIDQIIVRHYIDNNYRTDHAVNDIFELMEAYHQEKEVVMPSDEETAIAAFENNDIHHNDDDNIIPSTITDNIWIAGAKWMRDQLKPVDLREELIKTIPFIEFMSKYQKFHNKWTLICEDVYTTKNSFYFIEELIEEYLKTR